MAYTGKTADKSILWLSLGAQSVPFSVLSWTHCYNSVIVPHIGAGSETSIDMRNVKCSDSALLDTLVL